MIVTPDMHDDFWVFGYGSLMWNPGFPSVEDHPAVIHGYHRSLCVISTHYRGTDAHPGLVLGLDQGGECCGRVFKVAPEDVNDTIAYLDAREQVTKVYCPQFVSAKLPSGAHGGEVTAYTFVVRHEHYQYAKLSLDEQARLVATGVGSRGSALEYLANTVEHIDALGITDTELHRVLDKALAIKAEPHLQAPPTG